MPSFPVSATYKTLTKTMSTSAVSDALSFTNVSNVYNGTFNGNVSGTINGSFSALQNIGVGAPIIASNSTIKLSAQDGVYITDSVLRLASLTTAKRNLLTPGVGDTIYNNTLGVFQIYTGSSTTPLVSGWHSPLINRGTTLNPLISGNTVSLSSTNNVEIKSNGSTFSVSANNLNLSGTTRVVVSKTPFQLASFTTTERDALSPLNGDLVLNTTTNKVQARVNGSWVDLH